jgi:flagellin
MPAVINTNVASLNAQRNLSSSQSALQTSLQRLSSGLRINSAKDDAAGMAITERMTSQIRGLNQAARNANDGVSLAQTAEGGLAEVGNNLQRIRELAIQSANSTNSSSDRASLNAEVSQLLAEIQRVATTSQFNGQNILDGTFTAAQFQVGANANQTITASTGNAQTSALGAYQYNNTSSAVSGNALASGDLTINGVNVGASTSGSALARWSM